MKIQDVKIGEKVVSLCNFPSVKVVKGDIGIIEKIRSISEIVVVHWEKRDVLLYVYSDQIKKYNNYNHPCTTIFK